MNSDQIKRIDRKASQPDRKQRIGIALGEARNDREAIYHVRSTSQFNLSASRVTLIQSYISDTLCNQSVLLVGNRSAPKTYSHLGLLLNAGMGRVLSERKRIYGRRAGRS
jgi:hypothetical protein